MPGGIRTPNLLIRIFSLPCLLLFYSVRFCSDYLIESKRLAIQNDMKNSKQIRSGVSGKSGQEVAKHGFGKTDVRYWYDAIFKAEYRRDGQKLKVED